MTTILLLLALLFGSAANSGTPAHSGATPHTMDDPAPGGSGDTGGCIVQQGCGTGG
ncbi:MAG: hypothetical protein WDO73_26360 [Ignavibacteriota bacterium]